MWKVFGLRGGGMLMHSSVMVAHGGQGGWISGPVGIFFPVGHRRCQGWSDASAGWCDDGGKD